MKPQDRLFIALAMSKIELTISNDIKSIRDKLVEKYISGRIYETKEQAQEAIVSLGTHMLKQTITLFSSYFGNQLKAIEIAKSICEKYKTSLLDVIKISPVISPQSASDINVKVEKIYRENFKASSVLLLSGFSNNKNYKKIVIENRGSNPRLWHQSIMNFISGLKSNELSFQPLVVNNGTIFSVIVGVTEINLEMKEKLDRSGVVFEREISK